MTALRRHLCITISAARGNEVKMPVPNWIPWLNYADKDFQRYVFALAVRLYADAAEASRE
jgi:hypothetical protein